MLLDTAARFVYRGRLTKRRNRRYFGRKTRVKSLSVDNL